MRAVMLAFRANSDFAAQVDQLARFSGVSRSDYVRQAVEEKNARALAERVAFLSQALSTIHRQFNEELDASSGDGLADR
jgi:hypothetical protein